MTLITSILLGLTLPESYEHPWPFGIAFLLATAYFWRHSAACTHQGTAPSSLTSHFLAPFIVHAMIDGLILGMSLAHGQPLATVSILMHELPKNITLIAEYRRSGLTLWPLCRKLAWPILAMTPGLCLGLLASHTPHHVAEMLHGASAGLIGGVCMARLWRERQRPNWRIIAGTTLGMILTLIGHLINFTALLS